MEHKMEKMYVNVHTQITFNILYWTTIYYSKLCLMNVRFSAPRFTKQHTSLFPISLDNATGSFKAYIPTGRVNLLFLCGPKQWQFRGCTIVTLAQSQDWWKFGFDCNKLDRTVSECALFFENLTCHRRRDSSRKACCKIPLLSWRIMPGSSSTLSLFWHPWDLTVWPLPYLWSLVMSGIFWHGMAWKDLYIYELYVSWNSQAEKLVVAYSGGLGSSRHLHGITMSVVNLPLPPLSIRLRTKETKFTGLAPDILNHMSEALNFTINWKIGKIWRISH